jgi:hypothetical protein
MNIETFIDKSFEQEAQFDVFFKAIEELKKFVEKENTNASFALTSSNDVMNVIHRIREKHNSLRLSLDHYWTIHRLKMTESIVAHLMKRLHGNTDVMAIKYLHGFFQTHTDWPNGIKLYIMVCRTLLLNIEDTPLFIAVRKKILEQYQQLFPDTSSPITNNFKLWIPDGLQAITKPMKLNELIRYVNEHDTTTPAWILPFKKQQFNKRHGGNSNANIEQLIDDFSHNVMVWYRVSKNPVIYNTLHLTTNFSPLFNRGIHEQFIKQSQICNPLTPEHTPKRDIEYYYPRNRSKTWVCFDTLDNETYRLLQFPNRTVPFLTDVDMAKIKMFEKEVKPNDLIQREILNATSCMFASRIVDVDNMAFDVTVIDMEIKTNIIMVLSKYNITASRDLTEEILHECSMELWKGCSNELDSSEIQLSILRDCLNIENTIKKSVHNALLSQKPKTQSEIKMVVDDAITNMNIDTPILIAKKKFILTLT